MLEKRSQPETSTLQNSEVGKMRKSRQRSLRRNSQIKQEKNLKLFQLYICFSYKSARAISDSERKHIAEMSLVLYMRYFQSRMAKNGGVDGLHSSLLCHLQTTLKMCFKCFPSYKFYGKLRLARHKTCPQDAYTR